MKRKYVAAVLAFMLGIFGVHRFYLGQRFLGALYMFMFFIGMFVTIASDGEVPLVMIPAVLGFIDAVLLLVMPREDFDERYNRRRLYREERAYTPPTRRRLPRPVPARSSRQEGEEMYFKRMGIKKFRAYDYEGAIEDFLAAAEIKPGDPAIYFNLACCFSLIEDTKEAYYYLEKAVALGFRDRKKIASHNALAFLREDPEFEVFVANGYKMPVALPRNTPPLDLNLRPNDAPDAAPQEDTTEDLLDQIVKLGELRDQGILSDEEFSQQKRKILKSFNSYE